MSGWDWLHAGLEVATYAQARQAQQNLTAMKTAAEIEAAQKFLVEAMRNFIFDIARDIQLAEENIDKHPQQVYVIAKSLEWRLKDSGLTPEVFPEFSDKEYVFKTQKTIKNVVHEATSRLVPAQIEQADTAVKYITEMPSLQETCRAKSSFEEIQANEAEWKELEHQVHSSKTKRNFGFLGLIASPCLCFMVSMSNTQSSAGAVLGGFVLIGALVLLVMGSKTNPRYTELKTQRENLKKNLLSPEVWKQNIERLGGDRSGAEFQKLIDDRLAYLAPILGDEGQKFLTEG